jgi:hypothetical protein
LLPGAGSATKFAESGVFRGVALGLPVVGFGVGVLGNLAEGRQPLEALARAGVETGAGFLGASAGIAACGTVGLATAGVGGVACAGIVIVSTVGFSVVADNLMDAAGSIWDAVTFWDNH